MEEKSIYVDQVLVILLTLMKCAATYLKTIALGGILVLMPILVFFLLLSE